MHLQFNTTLFFVVLLSISRGGQLLFSRLAIHTYIIVGAFQKVLSHFLGTPKNDYSLLRFRAIADSSTELWHKCVSHMWQYLSKTGWFQNYVCSTCLPSRYWQIFKTNIYQDLMEILKKSSKIFIYFASCFWGEEGWVWCSTFRGEDPPPGADE